MIDWHLIHLFPEEAIKAAIDANAKKVMPVHWAGFALSYYHTWKEPAADFVTYASACQLDYTLPELGEMFEIRDFRLKKWWEEYD